MLTITAISMAYKALTPIYNGIIIIMRQSAPPIFVTTRNKRKNEVNGIDKEFVSEEEFEKLVKNKEVVVDFEFLGAKYGYRKEKLESSENQVTEVHYSTIYEIKKHTPNIFSIYIMKI